MTTPSMLPKHKSLVSAAVIALAGALWLFGALKYFERTTRHDLRGLIGYSYSLPTRGFEYRPEGHRIEHWAFGVPSLSTFSALAVSAIVALLLQRRPISVRTIALILVYHVFAAVAFCLVFANFWWQATDIFI